MRGFDGATTHEIAGAAATSKANVHYYYGSKENLYRAVLENILSVWLAPLDQFTEDADPAVVLRQYLHDKLTMSRSRADASRVFASEVINGGRHLRKFFRTSLRPLIDEKSQVIEAWIRQGKMRPVPPRHLFFLIWAATQTYADFSVQVEQLLGLRRIDAGAFADAEAFLGTVLVRGLGLRQ